VLPEDHPLAGLAQVPLSELACYPIVLHTAKEAAEWERWNEALDAEFGLKVAARLRGHGREAANAAILAYGHPGVGPLDAPVPEGLVVRPLVEPVPVYETSMVWRSTNRTPQAVRVLSLIREISEALGWTTAPATAWWKPAAVRR
jgi:DNA-binding transcriptional LysR family regulator